MFNLRSVDLNLLPVFEAVYEEQSLSRAAVRLAMTQSAVSHALARLRVLCRDELFVRHSQGVARTPAADRIYAQVRVALAAVREAVTESRVFDPTTSERRFVVAIPHPLGPMIVLRLQERLAEVAPRFEVVASTRSRPIDLDRALRDGRIDAAIDWREPSGIPFKATVLFDDAIIAVARAGHPVLAARAPTKRLRDARFVQLRPRVDGEISPAPTRPWRSLDPKVALEVSEILEIFMVASQSDLIGLIPRSMEQLARHTFGLRVVRSLATPVAAPIKLIWHPSRDADPAHVFFRAELARSAKRVVQKG